MKGVLLWMAGHTCHQSTELVQMGETQSEPHSSPPLPTRPLRGSAQRICDPVYVRRHRWRNGGLHLYRLSWGLRGHLPDFPYHHLCWRHIPNFRRQMSNAEVQICRLLLLFEWLWCCRAVDAINLVCAWMERFGRFLSLISVWLWQGGIKTSSSTLLLF